MRLSNITNIFVISNGHPDMKRIILAIALACCTLTLAAQGGIKVKFQGDSPTISDLAWAVMTAYDDEEDADMDESMNALKQAWIRNRDGLPQEEGWYEDTGFEVEYMTDNGAFVSYALPRTGKDIVMTTWYPDGPKQKTLKWGGRRFSF